jgi:hypothetical protein
MADADQSVNVWGEVDRVVRRLDLANSKKQRHNYGPLSIPPRYRIDLRLGYSRFLLECAKARDGSVLGSITLKHLTRAVVCDGFYPIATIAGHDRVFDHS